MPVRGRTAGNKGQGSKWCNPKTRRRIYERDGWRCVWCGCTVAGEGDPDKARLHRALATLDHVIPRSAGGTNRPFNLVTACMTCNRKRGGMPATSYASEILPGNDLYTRCGVLSRVLRAVCSPLPP